MANQSYKMKIKNGINPVKKDHRNYSATRTFGAVMGKLPDEMNVDANLTMPDQNADGFPFGCTGYTQSELCQDEDKALYKPSFTYRKSLLMADIPDGQPVDMEHSLKSTKVYGVQGVNETTDDEALKHRRGAYYQVEALYGDFFDSIRMTIATNKCSVSIATQWFSSFEGIASNGLIPEVFTGGFSWHNWKVSGWKIINGETYLIGKSWQGKNYGDNGLCYFSRKAINSLLATNGAGAFIVATYDPSKLQTVRLDILSTIISYLKMWLAQLTKKKEVTPPSIFNDTPADVYNEVKEAIKLPKYLWDTKQNIYHSMRMIGDEMGLYVLQKDLLCDIAKCESGLNPNAKLVNSPTSIDRGLFQWNSKYHTEITDEIAYDPEKATRLACKAILDGKAHTYWSASQFCWNKNNKYKILL